MSQKSRSILSCFFSKPRNISAGNISEQTRETGDSCTSMDIAMDVDVVKLKDETDAKPSC